MILNDALVCLSRTPEAPLDVGELALWLAKDEYHDLDVEAHLGELSAMAHEAKRYMKGSLPARVAGLCRYLFHDMGFRGNVKDYYDPRNSYLNQVMERRTGIPIALSALVMAVGRRAGLRVEGIGLPGHFIVKALDGKDEVLIDPFHGGRRLSATDCENLVRQTTGLTFEVSALALHAIPVGLMMQRLLANLKKIYLEREDYSRALQVMERLHQLNNQDAVLRRDIGACLVNLGFFGRALDHLRYYVEQAPEADDNEAIAKLLRNTERRLAKWN